MKGGGDDGVGVGRLGKIAVGGGLLRRLGAAVWDSRRRALAAVVGLFVVLLLPAMRAVAATVATVKGYGLYGRVPYDDWLFATSRLIDPDLLKRSFPELIVKELPIVLRNFKKRRLANELVVIVKGAAYLVAFLALFNLVYQSSLASIERAKRSGGGRPFSASAISKKGPRKGRQIEGMEDGWLDMDLTADEEDPPEPEPQPPKKPKK